MRKLLTVTVLALLVSLSATAQDFPKAEIFGGYQLTRLDGTTLNGWNAALTGNLNHWFGVTGDFRGAYKSESGVDFAITLTPSARPSRPGAMKRPSPRLLMPCLAGLTLLLVSLRFRRAITPSP